AFMFFLTHNSFATMYSDLFKDDRTISRYNYFVKKARLNCVFISVKYYTAMPKHLHQFTRKSCSVITGGNDSDLFHVANVAPKSPKGDFRYIMNKKSVRKNGKFYKPPLGNWGASNFPKGFFMSVKKSSSFSLG